MKTIIYFNEIDCLNCANEIAEVVSKVIGINKFKINFTKKCAYVEYDSNVYKNIDELIDIINKLDLVQDEKVIFSKEEKEEEISKLEIIIFLIGVGCFIGTSLLYFLKIFDNQILYLILFIICYLILGYQLLIKSIKEMIHGNIFNESFLMSLASILAFVVGDYFESCMLLVLYNIGEYLQDKCVESQNKKIANLSSYKITSVTMADGSKKDLKDVLVDEEIIVNLGEVISLDGIIEKGNTTLDMKSLTGESLPVNKTVGDEVLSGSVNLTSSIVVKVTKEYTNSTTYKIQQLIDEAYSNKSKTEEFISKFAKIYTPVVILLAVIIFLIQWLLVKDINITQACENAVTFLVSSCPCALIISVPLAVIAGIGKCSALGVLIKGGNHLEALCKVKTICFDKTGTLTKGNFEVVKEECFDHNNLELMRELTYNLEKYSNHPIAVALKEYCLNQKVKELNFDDIQEIPGKGIKCTYNDHKIYIGKLDNMNIDYKHIGSIVFVVYNDTSLGYYIISDTLKEDAKETINQLNQLNINTIMLTGDNANTAKVIGDELNLTEVHANLLPQDKLEIIDNLIKNKHKNQNIAFVGDGINDAPALCASDVGIAVGTNLKETIIQEKGDIVIMSNQLINLYHSILISKYTHKIMIENIVIALGIKIIIMLLASLNLIPNINMYLGVVSDVGVCLLCIFNSLRIVSKKIDRIKVK